MFALKKNSRDTLMANMTQLSRQKSHMNSMPEDLIQVDKDKHHAACRGEWCLANIVSLQQSFAGLRALHMREITIDGGAITKMDSAGAWLLSVLVAELK